MRGEGGVGERLRAKKKEGTSLVPPHLTKGSFLVLVHWEIVFITGSFILNTHTINAFREVGSILSVESDTSVKRTNLLSFRCLVRREIQTNI